MSGSTTPVLRLPGKVYDFIPGNTLHRDTRDGVEGVRLPVRLTSYRSLPLSCIAEVALSIDGKAVPAEDIVFVIDGHAYPLLSLRERTDIWWFILDSADLFVPLALTDGAHEVTGTLTTIMPFATGGRITDSRTTSKTLFLDEQKG